MATSVIGLIHYKIKDILEAVVSEDGTSKIVVVYNYPEFKPTGYPYAYIDFRGSESIELNNREDRVSYLFEVALIQEKFEELKGRANAENTARERDFAVSEAFRNNGDLDLDSVIRVKPLKSEKTYVENGTRIKSIITLEVETKEDSTI
jgi:hypothetical protein